MEDWKAWCAIPVRGKQSLALPVHLTDYAESLAKIVADAPENRYGSVTTGEYALIRPSTLGFTKPTRLWKVRKRALDNGLALCPPEIAFEIREHYADQADGEIVSVVSKNIEHEGHPCLFALVAKDGYCYLDWVYGDTGADQPYELLDTDELLLFQIA